MSASYDVSPAIPSQELLDRNLAYAANHKPKLGQDHWRNIPKNAIITCMDCRLHPHKQLGLGDDDIVIIRNAGGGVRELLNTVLVAQRFGVRHFILIKHTDCGGFYNTKKDIIENFKAHAKNPDAIDDFGDRLADGFGGLGIDAVALRDVELMRNSSVIYTDTVVSGWVFDDGTGKIRQVA
ncbi:hypothetical protein VKT23_000400 [Stygiomarasmius scandens]|uniref:Carbonic anhydrase n=1 Tax=Marasmiellus scandens TaxID=2682957 RepID=A0ABR1K7C1_9AGAR